MKRLVCTRLASPALALGLGATNAGVASSIPATR
jgi:hypothetical protein